jgi:hypothetical protein
MIAAESEAEFVQVSQWCQESGNSMRVAKDHLDNWHSTKATIDTLMNRKITNLGAPSHFIDADFLMTGGAGKARVQAISLLPYF